MPMTAPDPAFSSPSEWAAVSPEVLGELFDAALLEGLVSSETPDIEALFQDLTPSISNQQRVRSPPNSGNNCKPNTSKLPSTLRKP